MAKSRTKMSRKDRSRANAIDLKAKAMIGGKRLGNALDRSFKRLTGGSSRTKMKKR